MALERDAKNLRRGFRVAGLGRNRYRVEVTLQPQRVKDRINAVIEIRNQAHLKPALAQRGQQHRGVAIAGPVRRVGEKSEQRVEVGVEVGEVAKTGERGSHQPRPPFALQLAQPRRLMTAAESETGRRRERASEGIHHQPLVGLYSEAPRNFRIAQPGRLASMKDRTGRVEIYHPQHFVRFVLTLARGLTSRYSRPRMKRRSNADHPFSTRLLPLTSFP